MEVPEYKRDDSLDYVRVLEVLKEIPFAVGKNLLIDFLKGDYKNSSITNNDLDSLNSFGSLESYEKEKIREIIDNLINNNLIEVTNSAENRFMKLLRLTQKGNKEIMFPCLNNKKLKNNFNHTKTEITEEDRIKFEELKNFLNYYNDEQKKAIISDKEKILCIAGAGSGKTTALTKRIEFLVKYRGVPSEKILAVTFTRKARDEMQNRLIALGINPKIETFNSFCEKLLLKHNNLIYNRPMKVITYQNKIMAMMMALSNLNLTMNSAIDTYFSISQKRNRTSEELSNILMNDCFFILDYFKVKNQELYDFSKDACPSEKETAKMIYNICRHLQQTMNLQGLRDFTDQMLDVIKFFKSHKDLIPEYDHILVDEYQDVNAMQIELIDLLNPKNLFCVGDPRQSIFGWRGSDINYILKFKEKYPDSEIISLTKNYRSNKHLVDLMNTSIREMGLPDLESSYEGKKQISILGFEREQSELEFVAKEIMSSKVEKHEIFVLARTNSQLADLSRLLKQVGINHIIKNDDSRLSIAARTNEVTLATIHSIKGLEAKIVFIIGANEQNFPCKASDHPVIEIIKIEEYDKEEEEKRLFYVAISRAKHKLYITYTGKKPTYFINPEMMKIIDRIEENQNNLNQNYNSATTE